MLRYGLERLARDAAAAGIDGCLLTDASVEEARDYVGAMHRHGLDTVFLAAPTSTERRLNWWRNTPRASSTWSRAPASRASAIAFGCRRAAGAAVRAVTDLPLAVGFGISKPEHVAELGRLVEAVVVGSAIVRLIERNAANASLEIQLESFIRELKHGFGSRGLSRTPGFTRRNAQRRMDAPGNIILQACAGSELPQLLTTQPRPNAALIATSTSAASTLPSPLKSSTGFARPSASRRAVRTSDMV